MIRRASEADLPEILRLQRLAFAEEADVVGDPYIKPMSQTLEELRDEFRSGIILIYVEDDEILGSVRAFEEAGTCYISRMVVHPDHWREGIGTRLMKEIERWFDGAHRYELFTRMDHHQTRPFYQSLGYHPFKTEKISGLLTFVYLEKINE